MKAVEFRGMTDAQLGDLIKDTVQRLFKLRIQSATEKLDAPSEVKKLRRDLARIKTVQRERELGIKRKR